MSDLFIFDLQRFGDVVIMVDGNEVTVQGAIPSNEEDATEGAYYWSNANVSVGSSFAGNVTLDVNTLEDDETFENVTINRISTIKGIILPANAGAGAIEAGSGVGGAADNAIAITNLGTATVTVGDTTLSFNTDTTSGLYINSNSVAYVSLASGSFDVTNEGGLGDLYVGGYDAGNAVNINKPFTYSVSGTTGSITLAENGDGAILTKTDDASQVLTKGVNTITIADTTLNYSVAADSYATVDVSYDEDAAAYKAEGLHLAGAGDAVNVSSVVASEDFTLYDGAGDDAAEIPLSNLPSAGGYTVTKVQESVYSANGFETGTASLDSKGNYVLTNTSGDAAVLLNNTAVTGFVLGTDDAVSGTKISAVGSAVTLYKESVSTDNAAQIDLTDISDNAVVTRKETGFEISNIEDGGIVSINGSAALTYAVQGGTVTVTDANDEGKI